MDQCRLSVNTSGCFYHPLGDQTPIDCRYSESVDTAELPDKQVLLITGRHVIDFGRVRNPRGLEIHNVSNHGVQVRPTEEELAVMREKFLFVGFGDNPQPSLELPPLVPGTSQFGGSQFLWLAADAKVWLDVRPGSSVTVRLNIFPGASDG